VRRVGCGGDGPRVTVELVSVRRVETILAYRMKPAFLRPLLALLLSACAAVVSGAPAPVPAPGPLRVMSFNVRTSNAKDGDNAWQNREELFFETIARFNPDLIGFQEVVARQRDAIEARLPGYALAGVARDDGDRKGEWSLIAYRRDRFASVVAGDFWLSEQPDKPGSKSWDAALPRICSWIRLKEKATGRELVFANTHFDHRGVVARKEASRVLSERLAPVAAGVPAILVGDLNVTEDNPAYLALIQPLTLGGIRWIDSYRTVNPKRSAQEASFNAFKGTVEGSRIDFIFHTSHFKATAATIDRSSRDGRFPSDHYPVTAVLELKK
jgi:endonuclease/exonuclease/phosphatase family metal-dependent hydrolase